MPVIYCTYHDLPVPEDTFVAFSNVECRLVPHSMLLVLLFCLVIHLLQQD